ncbi:MAG: exodeoxyribonuclease VII large subunit [Bacteroidetes bacterium GWA2_30_7]|nr:MAG: exodeoxyribonuclease VII large subunit [Bacteroidetes bacterium GWA2_30_7]
MANQISLLQLNNLIKNSIKLNFDSNYWVVAEISDFKVNYSGHCYLELIQKNETETSIVAKARAMIWATTYRMLSAYFESETGNKLTVGIKVLVSVIVEFHELYGLSLVIKDIDPVYTIGENEKKRQDIIKRLKDEGVFEMNKQTYLPIVTKNIAIISSENAAGYLDFMEHLQNNAYNFKFHTKLFNASMQGESTESSVVNALDKIFAYEHIFDLVVIIRGGGSKSDLSWFDNYWIAYNISQFPIPVITGIGHEQDDTIADMVAFMRLKTPTAVADFIIEKCLDFKTQVLNYENYIYDYSNDLIANNKQELHSSIEHFKIFVENYIEKSAFKLNNLNKDFSNTVSNSVKSKNNELSILSEIFDSKIKFIFKLKNIEISQQIRKIKLSAKHNVSLAKNELVNIENNLNNLSPQNVLKRGFSVTRIKGKAIKSAKQLQTGDELETLLYDGLVKSTVDSTE